MVTKLFDLVTRQFTVALLLTLFYGSFSVWADSRNDLDATLSRYKAGDLEETLLKELNLNSYSKTDIPNLPEGQALTIYHLPKGDVRVSTQMTKDRQSVLSSPPFFVPDSRTVAQRLKDEGIAWDNYVKQLKQENQK